MTNKEWLNSLSDEELAEMLNEEFSCSFCTHYVDGEYNCSASGSENICLNGIKTWLNAKHEKPMPELKVGDVIRTTLGKLMTMVSNEYAWEGEVCCSKTFAIKNYDIIEIYRFNPENYDVEMIWRADND